MNRVMKTTSAILVWARFTLLLLISGLFANLAEAQQLDQPDLIQSFPVGNGPAFLASDGENIWVTNYGDTVTKIRGSDGKKLGHFPVGPYPLGVAFDGVNIWVGNYGDNTVTKLRASDGRTLATVPVGTGPLSLAFDGHKMWVTS